jgi:hypothetical protein
MALYGSPPHHRSNTRRCHRTTMTPTSSKQPNRSSRHPASGPGVVCDPERDAGTTHPAVIRALPSRCGRGPSWQSEEAFTIDLAVTDVERSLAFCLDLLGPLGWAEGVRYPTYRGTVDDAYPRCVSSGQRFTSPRGGSRRRGLRSDSVGHGVVPANDDRTRADCRTVRTCPTTAPVLVGNALLIIDRPTSRARFLSVVDRRAWIIVGERNLSSTPSGCRADRARSTG